MTLIETWHWACPKGRRGSLHVWHRQPDNTASCSRCGALLTVAEADRCFDASNTLVTRDRDGTRSAETACPAPVPQDCHEGIAPTNEGPE